MAGASAGGSSAFCQISRWSSAWRGGGICDNLTDWPSERRLHRQQSREGWFALTHTEQRIQHKYRGCTPVVISGGGEGSFDINITSTHRPTERVSRWSPLYRGENYQRREMEGRNKRANLYGCGPQCATHRDVTWRPMANLLTTRAAAPSLSSRTPPRTRYIYIPRQSRERWWWIYGAHKTRPPHWSFRRALYGRRGKKWLRAAPSAGWMDGPTDGRCCNGALWRYCKKWIYQREGWRQHCIGISNPAAARGVVCCWTIRLETFLSGEMTLMIASNLE